MKDIVLSIIVPVYNVSMYVEKCLESLDRQTVKNVEIVIVDDGSTDDSYEKCMNFIKGKEKFCMVRKTNGGLMSAWKEGVKVASGRYIGFVDSDDWVDDNMFEVLLDKIIATGADIVESGYIIENEAKSIYISRDKDYIFNNDDVVNIYLREYCYSYLSRPSNPTICRWDKVYKKELLLQQFNFMNESITVGEDFNTNIAVLMIAKKVVMIKNFARYHYRTNPNSIYNTYSPKRIDNVNNLAETIEKIISQYKLGEKEIRSFIGHMFFEEVNRICSSKRLKRREKKELIEKLKRYDASFYLDYYVQLRNDIKTKIYARAFKTYNINVLVCLNKLYKLVKG